MSLRLPREHENADFRHAGMDCRHQVRRMPPETSMSAWIPALHAGMTMRGMGSTIQSLEWLIYKGEHEVFEVLFCEFVLL